MILGLHDESKNLGSALNAHSVVPIQLGPTDPQVPLANVEHKQHRCRYDDRVWPVAPTLGIGTTAPGAKLEIAGTSGVDGIKFPDGSIQTTSATGHILITHELASGTDGGASVTGWQTRPLNSKKIDTNSLASLSSNQVTLTAGTYYCQATAPAFVANNHKLRLRNVTDGVTLIVGSSEYAYQPGNIYNTARLVGQFTIAAGKALELQHYISSAKTVNGLGVQTGTTTTDVEIYAILECWKN